MLPNGSRVAFLNLSGVVSRQGDGRHTDLYQHRAWTMFSTLSGAVKQESPNLHEASHAVLDTNENRGKPTPVFEH